MKNAIIQKLHEDVGEIAQLDAKVEAAERIVRILNRVLPVLPSVPAIDALKMAVDRFESIP